MVFRTVIIVDGIPYSVLEEFPIYRCCEVDHTGWIVDVEGKPKCVLTKYAKPYFAELREFTDLIKRYQSEEIRLINLGCKYLL